MYYIYHIPGVKIGCSTDPNRRVKDQGYNQYEILEEHTDIDIVSVREMELQKQYGYAIDCTPYKQSYDWTVKGRNAQEKGIGARTQIENKIGMFGYSKEERQALNKKNAPKGGYTQTQILRECPHCGKEGKGNFMYARHFDRCKLKK